MSPYDNPDHDESFTGILGKGRVLKSDRRIEALGSVDESNAALGMARTQVKSPKTFNAILQLQRDFYALMTEIATLPENVDKFQAIDEKKIQWLENTIQEFEGEKSSHFEFIVPGDSLPGAFLDLARTMIRRAERRVVELANTGEIRNKELVRYLNRASTLCYMMELYEYQLAGQDHPTLAKD